MTVLTWNTALDLDEGTAQDGVAHDVIAGNVAGTLRLGIDNAEHLPMRGARTWFNSPHSIRFSGAKDQTYIGGVNEVGDVVISALNHGTGEWTFFTLNAALEVDDHISPTILVRDSDSKVIVFYSRHNDDQLVRYRISTNAEDITAFGAEQTVDVGEQTSYVAPRQDATGNIQVFFNPNVTDDWDYIESTDGGATWTDQGKVISSDGERTYCCFGEWNNGRLDIGVTRIPVDLPGDNAEDVAHCYFDGASLYDSAGNVLNSGALPVSDLTITSNANSIIWDSSAETKPNAWIFECATHDDGAGNPRPEVLFTVYDSANMPSIEYQWARHNGTSWSQQAIPTISTSQWSLSDPAVTNGSAGYAGGLYLDHSQPGRMVLAELITDRTHSAIKEAVTTDDGASWTVATLVPEVSYSAEQLRWRPEIPRTPNDLTLGPSADIPALWSVGVFTSFTDWDGVVEIGDPGMKAPPPTVFLTCNEASGNAGNQGIREECPVAMVNGTTTSFYGATGVIGRNAFSFNGTDNYLALTGSSGWVLWEANHVKFGMVAIAFKTSATATQSLMGTLNDVGSDGIFVDVNSNAGGTNDPGNIRFWARADASTQTVIGDIGSAANANDGNWHMLIAWIDAVGTSDNWVVYLDGVQQTVTHSSTDDLGAFNLDEFDLVIGARQNRATTDQFFTGEIGEFRFYHDTQSATLAQDLWDQLSAGSFVSESKVA